jgi:hypothetical protein
MALHPSIDTTALAARTIELLGGPERAKEVADKEFGEMVARWDQDVDAIGRILRAHLYVEHYLTEFLRNANPRLGSLAEAKLSFAQKLALLDTQSPAIADLKPGIAHLNKIRNRLAHRLSAAIEPADASVFLSASFFVSMRIAAQGKAPSSQVPLEVLEQFSLHSAHILSGEFSAFGAAFSQALLEAPKCDDA